MKKTDQPTQPKLSVVYLSEPVQNPGIQGIKTLSKTNIPGLEMEMWGDNAITYSLPNVPSGIIYHPKSIVFEK